MVSSCSLSQVSSNNSLMCPGRSCARVVADDGGIGAETLSSILQNENAGELKQLIKLLQGS